MPRRARDTRGETASNWSRERKGAPLDGSAQGYDEAQAHGGIGTVGSKGWQAEHTRRGNTGQGGGTCGNRRWQCREGER
ncbi:hypothetical protein CLOM_g1642 [Closterium sp. NIES-68]|nr:hypothetical protein CLOM_g1642 [Closterium sp. NIES-68]GJP76613.1 hypothetical protein CLOP_g7031 [Closterium sp. NIES-67]